MGSSINLKGNIILLYVLLSCNTAFAKDMRNISSQWRCDFPVSRSGDVPTGNFFYCKEKGCNENAYLFYLKPETYPDIRNFIVDFSENNISYDWLVRLTVRAKRNSTEKVDDDYFSVKSKLNLISTKKIKSHDNVTDTIVNIQFEITEKEVDNDWSYYINTLSFHAGGTKIIWYKASPFIYSGKTMNTTIAYGQCEPL